MRSVWAVFAIVLLLAGCGEISGSGATAAGGYKLYEATYTTQSTLLAVIDSRTHNTVRKLAVGVRHSPPPRRRLPSPVTSSSMRSAMTAAGST